MIHLFLFADSRQRFHALCNTIIVNIVEYNLGDYIQGQLDTTYVIKSASYLRIFDCTPNSPTIKLTGMILLKHC